MVLSSSDSIGSNALKSPLVTKGSPGKKKMKKGKGMMFTFISDDMDVVIRISRDPIFDRVVGFQKHTDFLSEDMVEHIKTEVSKVHPEVDTSVYKYPLSEDRANELLFSFTSCMSKCKNGDTFGASYTTVYFF